MEVHKNGSTPLPKEELHQDFASRQPHATTCSLDPDITQGAMNRNALACIIQSSQGTGPVSLSFSLSSHFIANLRRRRKVDPAGNNRQRQTPFLFKTKSQRFAMLVTFQQTCQESIKKRV
jgi:hypothetical protein